MGLKPRVLVACEFSGTVRDAFTRAGCHAVSCDLLPSEAAGLHYEGDVSLLLHGWEPARFGGECDSSGDGWCRVVDQDIDSCDCMGPTQEEAEYVEVRGTLFARPIARPHWDLMVAHPPCTYLAVSGMHWNKRRPEREALTEQALVFVHRLMTAPIRRKAVENPISVISTRIRKPSQIVHPHQFGHDASKATCLWLEGLPPLEPTQVVAPGANGRWGNQTPSGQNKIGPSPDRWKERSRTFQGIADAMAAQWAPLLFTQSHDLW
jgi:hypothetical protein